MKKFILFILLIFINLINYLPGYCLVKGNASYDCSLQDLQTKTYALPPQTVENAILSLLEKKDYKITLSDKILNYTTASTNTKVRDTSYVFIAGNMVRLLFDTACTIATSGLRGYTVVNDLVIMGLEFKDKDLERKIAINLTPNNDSSTTIRINMVDLTFGKRDGFFWGPKNRVKTTNITDNEEYDNFFAQLDRELELQKRHPAAKDL